MYMDHINKFGGAVAGEEIISSEKALDEFVMLELRSSGLDLIRFENLFGPVGAGWLKEKYPYLELLKKKDFLQTNDNFIKLTPKGYAVCDEILKEIL